MNTDNTNSQIRVLLVDDSAVIRGLVGRWLQSDGEIAVVGSSSNGLRGVEDYERLKPDVVIMDIEMPVMDGIEALQKIIKIDRNAKIIMSSSLTRRNADISLRALSLGASDYMTKPTARDELHDKAGFQRDLIQKVKGLGRSRARARPAPAGGAAPASGARTAAGVQPRAPEKSAAIQLRKNIGLMQTPNIIAIGSSTGGPQALFKVFGSIASKLPDQPVVITQHMPATFTSIFSEHLQRASGMPCHEAKDGQKLEKGHIYVAPGDYHMEIVKEGGVPTVRLNQNPPENFCRPAVDPMLRSLVQVYGPRIFAVILTGMGNDGAKGCKVVVDAGGTVIAQDEQSSVVWGMPGAAAAAGVCSAVLPLDQIGPTIDRVSKGGRL